MVKFHVKVYLISFRNKKILRHLTSEEGEHQMLEDKRFSAVGETANEDQISEGRTDVC